MIKLLNQSLKRFIIYAGLVLIGSIPVYYLIISRLWQYEMDEHKVVITEEAAKHDSYMIIMSVTLLTTFFFILLLGGFVLLNRKISRRLWAPFYSSLGKIKSFVLGQQTTVDFEKTEIAEFAQLNESLHKLISGNISVYNQQKEFADNASHELQTPLAIVQSKLDMLLQSKSLTDQQYHVIEDAMKALSRVGRINKNLLLLTRIDNSQFMEKEEIDFSEVVEKALETLLHFADDKQFDIRKNISPGVMVEGNKVLVEIIINNLLTNALRHSAPKSCITINLSNGEWVIMNSGTGALMQEQLFRRFGVASSMNPGTGLGLALIKQVCERYKWEIKYSYHDEMHIFTLNF